MKALISNVILKKKKKPLSLKTKNSLGLYQIMIIIKMDMKIKKTHFLCHKALLCYNHFFFFLTVSHSVA